jgi:hypothetical protein
MPVNATRVSTLSVRGTPGVIQSFGAGPIVITPAAAGARAMALDPTVVLGSIAISPAFAAARALALDPTVQVGGELVEPAFAAARALALDPTVVLGSLSLTPAPASARALAVNPIVLDGSLAARARWFDRMRHAIPWRAHAERHPYSQRQH